MFKESFVKLNTVIEDAAILPELYDPKNKTEPDTGETPYSAPSPNVHGASGSFPSLGLSKFFKWEMV